MSGRSAGVVVGHVGVVRTTVFVGNHRHAAANPALDEQMHIRVGEELQRHARHFQHRVPAEARRGVVVSRVETVMLHARGAELLEDVGE